MEQSHKHTRAVLDHAHWPLVCHWRTAPGHAEPRRPRPLVQEKNNRQSVRARCRFVAFLSMTIHRWIPSIRKYKKEYQGTHYYKRLILGEWAAATGAVFDGFDETNLFSERMNEPNYYIAAIDYGTINATCCLLGAISPTRWPQIRNRRRVLLRQPEDRAYESRNAELADDIKRFISWRALRALYIDPAAASLKVELRHLDIPVINAENDVLPSIQVVNKFVYGKPGHTSCCKIVDQNDRLPIGIRRASIGA